MQHLLSKIQLDNYSDYQNFASEYIKPYASQWEIDEAISPEILDQCKKQGFTGCIIPDTYGGANLDMVSFGLLNEAFGRVSSSLTGLITVQSMFSSSLERWGTEFQKEKYLGGIANGDFIASFALTEPTGGSDISGIKTTVNEKNGKLILNGTKKWITFSGLADVFLVFAKLNGTYPIAVLVEKATPGVHVAPIKGMMGFKASHLSEITFKNCEIPMENMVGKPGFGLSFVANTGLHIGRISTAWSAAGMVRGCIEETSKHVSKRKIGDQVLGDFGTSRKIITQMGVDLEASQLLCFQASLLEDRKNPDAIQKTLIAKYVSSKAAVDATSNAVQLFGAAGCHNSSEVSHYYRNAKIMELIEGSSQVYEDILGKEFQDQHAKTVIQKPSYA